MSPASPHVGFRHLVELLLDSPTVQLLIFLLEPTNQPVERHLEARQIRAHQSCLHVALGGESCLIQSLQRGCRMTTFPLLHVLHSHL